jgi:multimeric flavodoxin WrbA
MAAFFISFINIFAQKHSMKKIFAFIGSPQAERSNCHLSVKMLTDKLIEKDKEITCEFYYPSKQNINYCQGCMTCFAKGYCPQDAKDDLPLLKKKMEEADLIIFASPNYIMNVSGQMKTFLDRLCLWFHIFPLTGKIGFAVMTTGGTQTSITDKDGGLNYLEAMLASLGVKSLGSIAAQSFKPGQFIDTEKLNNDISEAAEKITEYLSFGKPVDTDSFSELVFRLTRTKIKYAEGMEYARQYWTENGMINLRRFADLLAKTKTNTLQ